MNIEAIVIQIILGRVYNSSPPAYSNHPLPQKGYDEQS